MDCVVTLSIFDHMKSKKKTREVARVSMPVPLFEQLQKRAEDEMTSMSALIRKAIKNHLSKK